MKPDSHLETLFREKGSDLIIPAHYRWILEDQTHLYWLMEGRADLFIVDLFENQVGDGTPLAPVKVNGPLTFIHHLSSSRVLFSFPADHKQRAHPLIRADNRCHLRKLPKETVETALAASPELRDEFQKQLNEWVSFFTPLFSFEPSETGDVTLKLAWEAAITQAQKRDGGMWQALDLMARHLLAAHRLRRAKEAQKEEQKARLSHKIADQNLSNSFHNLRSVLEAQEFLFGEEGDDSLFKACQIVGGFLHIPFRPPSVPYQALSIHDHMSKICFDSDVYYREVKLKEGWWKTDRGPYVGFYGPQNKPVALLPTGRNRYQMVDAENHTVEVVDEKIDAELSLVVFVLYRSFPDKTPLSARDLFKFGLENKGRILLQILPLGLLAILLMQFIPVANNILYAYVIPYSDEPLLVQLFIGLFIILVTSHVFIFAREWLIVYLDGVVEHDVQLGLWQRMFELPARFFRRFEVGDLIIRAFSIETIRAKLAGPQLRVLINSLFSVIFLFPMLYFSAYLTLVGLLMILPIIGYSLYATIRNYRGSLSIVELQEKANALVLQFLMGISKIRNAGAENLCFVLWERVFFQIKKKQWSLEQLINRSKVLNFTLSRVGALIIYAVILLGVKDNTSDYTISLSNFLAFMVAFSFFVNAMMDLCSALLDVNTVFALWKNSKILLEEHPEVDPSKVIPPKLSGEVRADCLSFRYDSDGPLIVEDVSFYANPEEFIAIVGPSGSGKSTLASLLIGFETPESGAIFYDGKDLSSLNVRHLRKQIGTILQSSTIFDGTLRDNVSGGETFTDEQIKEALTLAGFEEDLKRMSMGLFTILTSTSQTISGGQNQRILIARSLITKPKILIFDEATSALDNQTQEVVRKNILSLKATRIVIAHRLSTIQQADRIYVMNKGRIMETGTYRELLEKKGFFYDLVEKQKFTH